MIKLNALRPPRKCHHRQICKLYLDEVLDTVDERSPSFFQQASTKKYFYPEAVIERILNAPEQHKYSDQITPATT